MATNVWSQIELRHLAALTAVAQTGAFGKAAEQLGYTQSSVSQQIAGLEQLVGQRLLERSRGSSVVDLTEAGKLLLRHAEAILARLHTAEADFAAYAAGTAGELRVGVFQSVGTRILPDLLREFLATWPGVRIRPFETDDDQALLSAIEQGRLDVAFAMSPLPEGPFTALELLRDPYVLVVPSSWPLAARAGNGPVSVDVLVDMPLVNFETCRTAVRVENELRRRGHEPEVVFRSDNNGAVQGMVGAGMGMAIMPRLTINEHDDRVSVLQLPSDFPPRVVCLVWHRERYRSPAAMAFAEAAQRWCDRHALEQHEPSHSVRSEAAVA
ncbi:MAG: LysR family transcriptional regulator [Chloroflexi bacterium]|nr:LysR family transcriptional regulator [Chloroflexota bacterium]MBV9897544.1 LysR family transcriptional regulator [Chloroflexota bacterium]